MFPGDATHGAAAKAATAEAALREAFGDERKRQHAGRERRERAGEGFCGAPNLLVATWLASNRRVRRAAR